MTTRDDEVLNPFSPSPPLPSPPLPSWVPCPPGSPPLSPSPPLQAKFPLVSTSVKKGSHTEQWPWAVEILHHQETIHASLTSFKDQNTLIECIGRQEGVPSRVGTTLYMDTHVHACTYVYGTSTIKHAYNIINMRCLLFILFTLLRGVTR